MKMETLYVILNHFGKSWLVKDQAIEKVSLPDLLSQGWKPVRETAFSNESTPSVLIFLERECDEKMGFGFQ